MSNAGSAPLAPRYDYIIVGAGSAGCVLANKLSEDPNISVLVVEAGPSNNNPMLVMPRGVGVVSNPGSKFISNYQAETGGNGPTERWFKGRVIGGSSSVNGMIYMRGAPRDYNNWESLGCAGWGWSQIGAKFIELENHDQGAGPSRGALGPLRVSTHPQGDALFDAVIQAGEQMGVARVRDINELDAVRDGGIGYQPTTTWRGKRYSAATAFLAPALSRPNLTVAAETQVLRIEFEGQRACALRLRGPQGEQTIAANREIILSAGAIETPKLLQLSGIGPASLLRYHGIEVVVDAPNVGENLREHRHFDIQYRVRGNSQNTRLNGSSVMLSVLRYYLGLGGPMTHAAHEVGAFAKSEPSLDHADLQFGLMSISTRGSPGHGEVSLDPFPGITFLGYFTRPESQGVVRIQSADPAAAPYINANHLSAEIDRRKAVAVVKWLRELGRQPALRDWIVEELRPGPEVATDEDILEHAMEFSGTCYHICGTARMGADERSVVDPQLRVRGVDGLRVVDTSIFPTIVSGNTNGPTMAVALRAADLIKEKAA